MFWSKLSGRVFSFSLFQCIRRRWRSEGLCQDLDGARLRLWGLWGGGGSVGSRLPSLKGRNSKSTGIFVGIFLRWDAFFSFFGDGHFFFEGLIGSLKRSVQSQLHLQPTKSGGFQDPAGTVLGPFLREMPLKTTWKCYFSWLAWFQNILS